MIKMNTISNKKIDDIIDYLTDKYFELNDNDKIILIYKNE
jgi:hypothetical protein